MRVVRADSDTKTSALTRTSPEPSERRAQAPEPTAFHNGWRGLFNAGFFTVFDRYIGHIGRIHKQCAFGGMRRGTIVEIGPGVGANFDFVPAGSTLLAFEPNLAMHSALLERARSRHVSLTLHSSGAERLPLRENSVDDVLCSLVLCTVDDPQTVLREIRRVLRPGGRLRFLEHVAAPWWSPRRWLQRVLRGPWSWLYEGCDLCRDTGAAIHAAGFSRVDLSNRRLRHSLFVPVNSCIHGIATK